MTRGPRVTVLSVFLALLAFWPAWGAAKLRVVATLPDLWALTRAVTGDSITVELATRFGQNPHDIEIRPSQILLVKRADVLVRNGLEEDAWIDPIVESAGNPKLLRGSPNVIEAVRGIQVLKVPAGPVDRSLGDVHPLGSPHFTLDPANIPTVTGTIAAGLAQMFPELAARFEANRQAFLERLAAADHRWKALLAPFRGVKLVSYHDSWPYFYRAFGLVEGGIIEDRPGIPPSPQHLALLIQQMKAERMKAILLETWYPADLANLVARETGAKVLVVPQTPGSVKGTEDYIAHLEYLVTTVANALH
jgi:zinc/manganese transport system substrate-binding protein